MALLLFETSGETSMPPRPTNGPRLAHEHSGSKHPKRKDTSGHVPRNHAGRREWANDPWSYPPCVPGGRRKCREIDVEVNVS